MSKADINQVTLEGNLTRDPELKFTTSGKSVADFGLATNDSKPDGKGGWEDIPNYFDITAWETLGENIATSLSKGDRVVVHGRLRYETWEAEDGSKRSKVRVVADTVAPSLRWATSSVTRNPKGERVPAAAGASASKLNDYIKSEEDF